MYRILIALILPVLGVVAAVLVLPYFESLAESERLVLEMLPLFLGFLGLVLSLRFNRSRIFFSLLVILSSYVVVTWDSPLKGKQVNDVYNAICLFLPLNLMVFSLVRERGVFTLWGLSRFVFILLQVATVLALFYFPEWGLSEYFQYRFTKHTALSSTPITQPALLMFIISLFVMNGRLFAYPTVQDSALFGSLLVMTVVLHFQDNNAIAVVFTSVSLLMLTVAVIQDTYSMAYIDQLTGLPGRRALSERLLKLGGQFSVAMLDVDHFKKFNDKYGHDVGDQVLRMVSSRIREVGSGGKAFRYGGEEFCIIFPGKEIFDVMDDLEEIRARIAATPFDLRRQDRRRLKQQGKKPRRRNVAVTVSIGVAERGERGKDPWDIVKLADKALYRAKKKGRNRVSK